jgi:hypothetical protein
VEDLIVHLLFGNQLVLFGNQLALQGDGDLHVVTDAHPRRARHGAGAWVRQRRLISASAAPFIRQRLVPVATEHPVGRGVAARLGKTGVNRAICISDGSW